MCAYIHAQLCEHVCTCVLIQVYVYHDAHFSFLNYVVGYLEAIREKQLYSNKVYKVS